MRKPFDYIIAGAGLSGLSLAWKMIRSPLSNKKLLIVDQNLTPENEKIWSFWHRGAPPFKNLIHKSWQQVQVLFDEQTITESLHSYAYHSIRSGRFKKAILKELSDHASVTLLEAPVQSLQFNDEATLQTPDDTFTAEYIFQSCLPTPQLAKDVPSYPLIQHFLGWEITTAAPVFDSTTVTLMDFDTGFSQGVAFIYILPWTAQKALLEYTIFSDTPKEKAFYKEKLSLYIHNKFNLRPLDYKIGRSEYGEIPMQDHRYAPYYANKIINMGTVGGLTKPSTGYTFSRIQQHVNHIVENLKAGKAPSPPPRSPFRYRAYDLWLLHIMHSHPKEAVQIFRQLFSHNSIDDIFRFLSEQNSLPQDLRTMSKVSYPPFFRAMWQSKKRLIELM